MNNLPGRLVIYLVGAASLFMILFGIRGLASVINPILLALVITITVQPIPGRLTRRGVLDWSLPGPPASCRVGGTARFRRCA